MAVLSLEATLDDSPPDLNSKPLTSWPGGNRRVVCKSLWVRFSVLCSWEHLTSHSQGFRIKKLGPKTLQIILVDEQCGQLYLHKSCGETQQKPTCPFQLCPLTDSSSLLYFSLRKERRCNRDTCLGSAWLWGSHVAWFHKGALIKERQQEPQNFQGLEGSHVPHPPHRNNEILHLLVAFFRGLLKPKEYKLSSFLRKELNSGKVERHELESWAVCRCEGSCSHLQAIEISTCYLSSWTLTIWFLRRGGQCHIIKAIGLF